MYILFCVDISLLFAYIIHLKVEKLLFSSFSLPFEVNGLMLSLLLCMLCVATAPFHLYEEY